MAAVTSIIKNKVILRAFIKRAGQSKLYLIPTLCLDYSNEHEESVRISLNIQIVMLCVSVGLGITILNDSEKQEL